MIERKNAFTITKKEQDTYINGVNALISDGTYGKLVAIHMNMGKFKMHTMNLANNVGRKRFLPWHRAYLLHFETELRKKEKDAFIPYLKWTGNGIPSWMSSFKPDVDVPGYRLVKNNRNDLTSSISTAAKIDAITAIKTYYDFTFELEVKPHNSGHNLIGGAMKFSHSPADPIFFMHHGEVDRIWAEWQASNPGKKSSLTGPDATMTPWTDTVSSLESTALLGYRYV